MNRSTVTSEERPSPEISQELIGGLVLFLMAAVFLLNSGDGRMDWLFPQVLSYLLIASGVVMLGQAALGRGKKVPLIPPILRGKGVDVVVFTGLAIVYVVLARPVGFWIMSFVTLFGAAVYLATRRDRRVLLQSLAVVSVVVVVGYVLLLHVFYVPLPATGDWWPL